MPQDAVIAVVLTKGNWTTVVPIYLGKMTMPSSLGDEAGAANEEAIFQWIAEEMYSLTGVRAQETVRRLMGSMCLERCDFEVPSY